MKILVADDDRVPFPFDTSEAAPKSGALPEREGLLKRVFNANTQDFLFGTALVGGASYATRIGVLTAATAVGAGALPTVLIAGAFTGLVAGSFRFARESYKAGYDFKAPETYKMLCMQLLKSTALSTIGGGVGYAFVNHYDVIVDVAQKTGVPAWIGGNLTALANSSVGIAVAEFSAPAVQALGQFAAAAKTAIVDTYNAVPGISETIENGKALAGRVYEGAASYLKGAYNSLPDVSGGLETAVQGVKGWWKSAMNSLGFSQVAQASTPNAADNSLTFAERMGEVNNVTVVEQAAAPQDVPVAAADPSEIPVHRVKPIRVLPDGTFVPDETPVPEAATPPQAAMVEAQAQEPPAVPVSEPVTPEELAALEQIEAQRAETPLYVQDYFARPQGDFAIKQPPRSFAGLDFVRTPDGLALPEFDANSTPKYLPKLSEKFTIHSWANRFDDLASGVTPENFEEVFADLQLSLSKDHVPTSYFDSKAFTDRAAQIVAKAASGDLPVQNDIAAAVAAPAPDAVPVPTPSPVPAPGSMKEQIGSYFEDKHLSRRAERIMEKAMSGDLQGQKDLAMNLLHGTRGLPKDPAMAMKLYDNVIAQGSIEGKHPRGAVFQAMRDKAWVLFYGYGDVPADQEAAKSAMSRLAEFNSGARRMLREWAGEKVSHVATASRHVVASARDSVAGKMPDKLSCNWLKAGNTIVSGTCKGNLGLKVGDKITLNP